LKNFHFFFNYNYFYLETGSVLDSRDVSYLNDLHKRDRRRIESASDMDDRSTFSDDVINLILFFEFLITIFF
jgi:hypothetical protein